MKLKPFFLPKLEALPESLCMPLVQKTLARLALVCGLPLSAVAADHDSSHWEKYIVRFEAADKKQMPAPGGILFIGSSSIRMWKTLKHDFAGFSVINRGFGGSQIADSVYFAGRIVHPYKPRQIVLYAGDNDVAAGKSGSVPPHLRDGHYKGAQGLGNAVGYKYPHSSPGGVLGQQYPPDELVGVNYYEPTEHGAERERG